MSDALVTVLIIAVAVGAALYGVPLAARRMVEREEQRRSGWLHDHVDRERRDPRRRARRREPETEEDP